MRRLLFIFVLISIGILSIAQEIPLHSKIKSIKTEKTSYKKGEWLKFRIHYGFVNAGYATLKLKESNVKGQTLYHAIGKGWTVGAASLFFQIDDFYESHFTLNKVKPIKFKRRVDEGGYIIKRDLFFNHKKNTVFIDDLVENTHREMSINNVQDMLSAFYHLRNYDLSKTKKGDELVVNLFFDNEIFPFKLIFLEKEIIKTEFGKIRTWKIRPLVQKGRVFEGQESLTLWISDDDNKIPIRIKASLAVGSLKADLQEFSGLSNPFMMIKD